MKRILLLLFVAMLLLSQSCKVTLSGASTVGIKTINVKYFENDAPLVVNNLSQLFTEALKERIRTQTSLSIVRGDADATLEGSITGYSIAPIAIQATADNRAPVAGQTRLTITVNVTYSNPDKKNDFTNFSVSRYADFTGALAPQEQNLIQQINKQLTEDIFNKAFANW